MTIASWITAMAVVAPAAMLLKPTAAGAHDFWLEVRPSRPAPGQAVGVTFSVGEQFLGEAIPFTGARTLAFEHVSADGREPIPGREGQSPAAVFPRLAPGVHVIAYTSAGTEITLEADRFNRYLLEEGLEEILEVRRREGRLDQPGRERFARYAKVIFVSGEVLPEDTLPGDSVPRDPVPGDPVATRVLGQRLEIIPEFDPADPACASAPAGFRILFEGEPLSGADVFAIPESSPLAGMLQGTTDGEGRIQFHLDRPGPWMVKLVHMERCRGCPDADWESSWGSLILTPHRD